MPEPAWRKTVPIKDLLDAAIRDADGDYPDRERTVAVAKEIAARVRAALADEMATDTHLAVIVDELEDVGDDTNEDPVVETDRALDRLYDWGDAKRVWLG